MTTLADRLSQRSGLPLGAHTVAEHLRAMVSRYSLAVVLPATMATVLIAYSGLPAGRHTVAEHLAVDRAVTVPSGGFFKRYRGRYEFVDEEQREQIEALALAQKQALAVLPVQARKAVQAAARKEALRTAPKLESLAEITARTAVAYQAPAWQVIEAMSAAFAYRSALADARRAVDDAYAAEVARERAAVQAEIALREQRLAAAVAAQISAEELVAQWLVGDVILRATQAVAALGARAVEWVSQRAARPRKQR